MDQIYTNDTMFYKDLDENLAWLTQKTEELKYNKGTFTPRPHPPPIHMHAHTHTHTHARMHARTHRERERERERVNAIELQSNKKVATPNFYTNPTFSGLSPLSRKFLVPPLPQVTQFLEGPWVDSNYEMKLTFVFIISLFWK